MRISYYAEYTNPMGLGLIKKRIPKKEIGFYWVRGAKIYKKVNGRIIKVM